MKKTLFAISAIAVLLGFTACTSENETIEPQKGKTITIKAYTEEATRTALDGNDTEGYSVVWSEGDKIMIGTNEFSLKSGAESTIGVFEGTDLADGTYDVWYGVNNNTLPTVQTYKAGAIINSPMYASVTVTEGVAEQVQFKNLCGLLRLSLKGTATIRTITISAEQAMAGAFTVNTDGGAELEESADDKSITLDCGAGVTLNEESATDFYIAMPAKTYTGVSIKLTDTDSKSFTKTLKTTATFTITRSVITPATFTLGTFATPKRVYGHGYVELAGNYWGTENVYETSGETFKDAGESGYGSYYTQSNANTAAENWSGVWALPSEEQWQALLDGCTWTWMTDYKFGGKTMNGYLVTDKNDVSKFIFLPAAGYYNNSVEYKNDEILYWSSGYDESQSNDKGRYLFAYNAGGTAPKVKYGNEETGFSVRPVAIPLNDGARVKIDGHYGIVVNINEKCKCIFATMNVGATAEDGPGCLAERLPLQDSYEGWEGWRVPTIYELTNLVYDWGDARPNGHAILGGNSEGGEGKGIMIWKFGSNRLYLPMEYKHQEDGDEDNDYAYGVYWSLGVADDPHPEWGDGEYFRLRLSLPFSSDYGYQYDVLGDTGDDVEAEMAPRWKMRKMANNLAPDADPCLVRLVHDIPEE